MNGADSASRLRFTLAHELGHHVFHDDRSEDTHAGIVTSGHWIEVRANAFAAELLAPAPAVVAWMAGRAASIDTIVELANAFGTSTVASAIRLETAGLATTTEIQALRAEIEADAGLLYAKLDYEDSISAARRHLPRTPNANSVLAMRLPAERVARQLGRQTTEVATALALVAPGEEEVV